MPGCRHRPVSVMRAPSLRPIDGDRRRTIAPATDQDPPRTTADVAVLHHLAALLRVDVQLDQLEAIGALHLHGVVHAPHGNTGPRAGYSPSAANQAAYGVPLASLRV